MNSLTFGQGQPVLLIPGWGLGSQILLPLALNLAKYAQVTLVDLPGYGENYHQPCPLTLDELAKLYLPLLTDNTIVIGWSLGGLLALQLAKIKPSIQAIVIATNPCFIAHQDWPGVEYKQFNELKYSVMQQDHLALKKFILLNVNSKNQYADLNNAITASPTVSKTTLLTGLALLEQHDLRAYTSNINFILFEQDKLVPIHIIEHLEYLSFKIYPAAPHAYVYFGAASLSDYIKTLL